MEEIRIKLSALWVVLMLTYLLGDVVRIFSGDFVPGEIQGKSVGQGVYLGIAAFMVIPIVMVFLSLVLPHGATRWSNIIVAIVFFVFNVVSLATYSPYDQFLLVVSFVWNALTVWYAWKWV